MLDLDKVDIQKHLSYILWYYLFFGCYKTVGIYQVQKKFGNNLNIWLGLLKIAEHKSLLAEKEFENIDGDPNELSLFSCVVLANIHWIPSAKVLCIKNMHFGRDNGNNEKVENIKSFMSYFVC